MSVFRKLIYLSFSTFVATQSLAQEFHADNYNKEKFVKNYESLNVKFYRAAIEKQNSQYFLVLESTANLDESGKIVKSTDFMNYFFVRRTIKVPIIVTISDKQGYDHAVEYPARAGDINLDTGEFSHIDSKIVKDLFGSYPMISSVYGYYVLGGGKTSGHNASGVVFGGRFGAWILPPPIPGNLAIIGGSRKLSYELSIAPENGSGAEIYQLDHWTYGYGYRSRARDSFEREISINEIVDRPLMDQ